MTAPELRSRLEALLGPVHLAERAAEALGVSRATVFRWLNGDCPVPLYVVRHVETVEAIPAHSRPLRWSC